MLLAEKEIISISHNFLRYKISRKLGIKIKSIHTIMSIGSYVQPLTMRQNSDIDLVFFLEDNLLSNPQHFKAGYQINFIRLAGKKVNIPIDIKIYSLSSFKEEMHYGSLTQVFAILNAFKIIRAENNAIHKILNNAEERLNLSVKLAKDNLQVLEISSEVRNLENYFNNALSILFSERIVYNPILLRLRFYEFLKEYITQFQRILFAVDLQNKTALENIDQYIKNLIIFKNIDGTRLLDPSKYSLDHRVEALLEEMRIILDESGNAPFKETIALLFNSVNCAFIRYTGFSIINQRNEYEYFASSNIQKVS